MQSKKVQRKRVGRLILQASTGALFAMGIAGMPRGAKADTPPPGSDGTITVGSGTVTVDHTNSPPDTDISDHQSVEAYGAGTLNINNSSITDGFVSAGDNSHADGTLTGNNIVVNTTYFNGIVQARNGGQLTLDNSTITGTLADSATLAQAITGWGESPSTPVGIQTVIAKDAGSVVTLTNTTVNTYGYNHGYLSDGASAYSGGTINLNNVTFNSTGDKTYGIADEGDNGHITGTGVNITTDGDTSYGVFAYGPNSTINLTGGSITTNGTNSAGVYVNTNSTVNLTDLTVTANDPTSDALEFKNTTTGSITADNTILNGNIGTDGSSGGTVNLTNGSVLNGAVDLPDGTFTVDSTSTWNNTGNTTLTNFTNGNYVFAPPADPSNPAQYHTLTVDNFTANAGSNITMNVFADGGNSTADQVVINNSYTGSPTQIIPVVTGGSGVLPNGGLVLVQGNGSSFTAGDFTSVPVNAGFYTYTGNFSDASGSPQYLLFSQLDSVAAAASVLPALGSDTALSTLPTVQDFMHAPRLSVTGTGEGDAQKGIWARIFGGSNKFQADDPSKNGFNTTLWALQAGYDLMAKKSADGGRDYAGLYLAYGNSSGNAQVDGNNVGRVDLDATSLGAYWAKYTPSNWYLGATAQYSWLNGINASGGGENVSPGGSGFALSLEGGKTLNQEKNVLIEPQAQLIYQHTDIDDSVLPVGPSRPVATPIDLSSLNAVTGRLGLLFQKNPDSGKNFLPWARVNLWHTFSGTSTMSTPGSEDLDTSIDGTSAELQAGFNLLGSESSKWAVDAGAGYLFNLSGAENSGWRGTLGMRYNW